MSKNRYAIIGVMVVAVCLLCISNTAAADYQLNVNSALTTDDPLFKGLEAFKKNIEAKSNDKIAVKLFPSSQLGKDEDVLEQASVGAPVAVVVDGGRLAVFEKELGGGTGV